ncbi:MAG: maltokinase, partial [Streptomyces sp.]|nr:maltokinase [Streptomyces sp.]
MTLPFADWLPHQRWYAGRSRTLTGVKPVTVTALQDDLDHVLLDASYADGGVERYQVFVGWNHTPPPEFTSIATIGVDSDRTGYDALYDEAAGQRLLPLIHVGASQGNLRLVPEPGAELPVDAP